MPSPHKSDKGLKSDKGAYTHEECLAWMENPSRNPRTNRAINPNAKNGTYHDIQKACQQLFSDDPRHKYCRCLMHVRVKTPKPYGICTKSVVWKYNIKQPRFCVYDFSTFTTAELLAYAQEKKINTTKPKINRQALIRLLHEYQETAALKYSNAGKHVMPTAAVASPKKNIYV